jgi:cell division protein FtsQ
MAFDATHRPALGAVRSGELSPLWKLRLAAGVLLVVLCAEVVYIALASPRFALRTVTVRGDSQIAPMVAAGIRLPENTNMLRAPVGLVERQAESVPAVKEARVNRAFPNRLVVTVERREAVAVIRGAERALLVDRGGLAFSVPDEWGWGLPELVSPHLQEAKLGGDAGAKEIGVLLGVLRALGPEPKLRTTRLQLRPEGQIEITLDSGGTVNMGRPTELAAKSKLLEAALEQIGPERIARLDLSEPAAAFWEPRERTVAAAVR